MKVNTCLLTQSKTSQSAFRALSTLGRTLLALSFLTGLVYGQSSERSFDETYDIGTNGQFSLANVSGTIELRGEDTERVRVRATKDGARGDSEALDQVEIEVSHNNDRLRIETKYRKHDRSWGGRSKHVSVNYEVAVPRGTQVTLTSVSGKVTVTNLDGHTKAKSVSGDVEIEGVRDLREAKSVSGAVEIHNAVTDGNAEIGSVSGDVTVERIEAESLELSTVSGDLSVSNAEASRVELKTVSGEVRYDGGLDRRGRYEFKSHSGDVEIFLPAGSGFDLEAKTFSGSIRSDFEIDSPSEESRRRRKSLRGSVGDAGATIEATSFSGDVRIYER